MFKSLIRLLSISVMCLLLLLLQKSIRAWLLLEILWQGPTNVSKILTSDSLLPYDYFLKHLPILGPSECYMFNLSIYTSAKFRFVLMHCWNAKFPLIWLMQIISRYSHNSRYNPSQQQTNWGNSLLKSQNNPKINNTLTKTVWFHWQRSNCFIID